jgi:hypothetical protein
MKYAFRHLVIAFVCGFAFYPLVLALGARR